MKTQIIVMIFMVLSAKTITASPSFINSDERKSIIVNRGEWKSNNVNVHITDENGFTIFTQKLDKKVGLMKYNMSLLKEGKYFMEISDDLRIVSKEFNMGRNQVITVKGNETFFKPQIKISNNLLDVNLLSLNEEALVTLTDNQGNTLHSEKMNTVKVHKRMNVNNLPSGNYTLSVKIGERYYTHNFTK